MRAQYIARGARALIKVAREEGVDLRGSVVLGTINIDSLVFQEDPDPEHVEEFVEWFAEAIRAGDPWPAGLPLIWVDSHGKIWDGHHRAAASFHAGYRRIPVLRLLASRGLLKIMESLACGYEDLVDAVGLLDPRIRGRLRYSYESMHWKGR
jgi:hypothetical protein